MRKFLRCIASEKQGAFIRRSQIPDSIFLAHMSVDSRHSHTSEKSRVLCKLYFEKAFNKYVGLGFSCRWALGMNGGCAFRAFLGSHLLSVYELSEKDFSRVEVYISVICYLFYWKFSYHDCFCSLLVTLLFSVCEHWGSGKFKVVCSLIWVSL